MEHVRISSKTINELCMLIDYTGRSELEFEINKKQLGRTPGFNPHDAFIHIDNYKTGSISVFDISDFLKYNIE